MSRGQAYFDEVSDRKNLRKTKTKGGKSVFQCPVIFASSYLNLSATRGEEEMRGEEMRESRELTLSKRVLHQTTFVSIVPL